MQVQRAYHEPSDLSSIRIAQKSQGVAVFVFSWYNILIFVGDLDQICAYIISTRYTCNIHISYIIYYLDQIHLQVSYIISHTYNLDQICEHMYTHATRFLCKYIQFVTYSIIHTYILLYIMSCDATHSVTRCILRTFVL